MEGQKLQVRSKKSPTSWQVEAWGFAINVTSNGYQSTFTHDCRYINPILLIDSATEVETLRSLSGCREQQYVWRGNDEKHH